MNLLAGDNKQTLLISVKCDKLKDTDFIGKSDPRAKLMSMDQSNPHELGVTETAKNNLSPEFNTKLTVDYFFQQSQRMRIVIEDEDGPNKYEPIGEADFELAKLVACIDMTMSLALFDKKRKKVGTAILTAEKQTKDTYLYKFDLRGKGIKDLEWFSKSDPCIRIYRPKPAFVSKRTPGEIPLTEWVKVHETEYRKNDLNADFEEFSIGGDKLCRNNEKCIIRVDFWDFGSGGEKNMKRIGTGFTTVEELLNDKKEIETLDDKKKPSGTIIIEKFEKDQAFDLMDYLAHGLSLNMVFMVDFSTANGDFSTPASLHHISKDKNAYEKAMESVGSVLMQYDNDGQIPLYGFAGTMPKLGIKESKDFFYIQGEDLAYAKNIEEVLKLYESCFDWVHPGGPCKLAPGIKAVNQWVKEIANNDKGFYSVLLVFTTGHVADMQDTIMALVESSTLPLSVLMIGVGSSNFDDLRVLDSDSKRLEDKNKKKAERDVVQFVEYRSIQSMQQLSSELLAEIPCQVVEYFRKKRFTPKDLK